MEWTDTGIVLNLGTFREADIWLKVLFKEHGVQTVFAFGGQRSRRRFVGCLDRVNEIECLVKTSRNGLYLELCETVLVSGPGPLRSQRSRLGLCMNCLKLVECASVTQESSCDSYMLVRELIRVLGQDAGSTMVLGLLFRLRFVALQGYSPIVDMCTGCGAERHNDAFFSVEDGGVLCPSCLQQRGRVQGVSLSGPSLNILSMALRTFPAAWTQFFFSPKEQRNVAFCVDGMLRYHAGLTWDRGRFCRI